MRAIIAALPAFQPAGARRTGRPGHPVPVYDWTDLVRLHAAISPWLTDTHGDSGTIARLQCARDRIPKRRLNVDAVVVLAADRVERRNHDLHADAQPPDYLGAAQMNQGHA